MAGDAEDDEGDEKRDGNDETGDEGCAPVAKEKDEYNGREKNADEDGVANAGDGIVNDGGLVVESFEMDVGWERGF